MRILVLVTAMILQFAAQASAQLPEIGHFPNELGIYTTPTPTSSADTRLNAPTAGTYTVYLVLSNPWNTAYDRPICEVGGYDLGLRFPTGWSLESMTLPPGAIDFDTRTYNFLCQGNIPVVSGQSLLATLHISCETPVAGSIRLAPNYEFYAIPGQIAVLDYCSSFEPYQMNPISGRFMEPVMGINMDVVAAEDVTWGDVKTLYR